MRPTLDDVVTVDFETAVDGNYSLEKMSARAYIVDPRFDILSVAIADGPGDIAFFHKMGRPGATLDEARERLRTAAQNGKWLVAHNAAFDGMILSLRWNIWFRDYFDSAGYLRFLGLGASLENGSNLVGVPKQSAPLFTLASLSDPAALEQLLVYNAVDVLIARELFRCAASDAGFLDLEFWFASKTTCENLEGIALDRDRAAALARDFANRRDESLRALCRQFPSFDTSAINAPQRVLAFCNGTLGGNLATMDKRDPGVVAAKTANTPTAAFLSLREEVQTWGKYSKAAAKIAAGPERLYASLRYFGAHTGRMSAGGRDAEGVNVQNLPRGDAGTFAALRELRGVLVPDEGESWVSADLSTIEPRVTAFLAGQTNLLERFAHGDDVYVWFASMAFPGTPIVKGGVNDHLRQLGKQTVIALGFGMGLTTFHEKLRARDPSLSRDLAEALYRAYQDAFPRIVDLRKSLWAAFEVAIDQGSVTTVGGCTFERVEYSKTVTLRVWLPTGRPIYYPSIDGKEEATPWGRWSWTRWYAPGYSFDATRRSRGVPNGQRFPDGRIRQRVLPQTLIENIVQAVARDLLVAQAREVERTGLRMRFSVHDELIVGVNACACAKADCPRAAGVPIEMHHEPQCGWLSGRLEIERCMSSVPDCYPALAGLPVACELNDAIRTRYAK